MVAPRLALEGLGWDDIWPEPFRDRRQGEHFDLDLLRDEHAYFYGLALSDGSIPSRPGRLTGSSQVVIEIRASDDDVLRSLTKVLPWKFTLRTRTRPSVFDGSNYTSTVLACHEVDLRRQMIAAGFPVGAKSKVCRPPIKDYNAHAFWRGYLDGDGSIGMTAGGIPFVSLVTVSAEMQGAYCDFIAEVAGYPPSVSRNARDRAWNVMLTRDRALSLIEAVYGGASLAIQRKITKADEALSWVKPPDGRLLRWERYRAAKAEERAIYAS